MCNYRLFSIFCCLAASTLSPIGLPSVEAAEPFVAVQPAANSTLPPIVLQYDATTKTGFDWQQIEKMHPSHLARSSAGPVQMAVSYLRESVQRMTGKELPVTSANDLSLGIVLTLLESAPVEIKTDAKVLAALRNTGKDSYNANEAFYLRSEPNRVLLVANTTDGFMAGVDELLESIGYEVLGMGPNWTHVPDFREKPLVFNLERAERPGFYIRSLWATSGQGYGVGTLSKAVPHEDDEPVEQSYERWRLGTRLLGQSMPNFPGHAMQRHHRAVVEKMRETKTAAGFLVEKTYLDLEAKRPEASAENKGHLWINTDAAGASAAGKVFISDGEKWVDQNLASLRANLDLSVPLVREVILEDLKQRAEAHFKASPDELLIFGTDPEDGGGYGVLGKLLHNKNWYPEYLKAQGKPLGEPYVLHNFKGLNQPREIWDPEAASDTVFGFNNWLLREFDKYVDSLPAGQRKNSSGADKKQRLRASLYSYNFHDVPPNFNLDPRIRVMIAGYPKHRGWDKWKNFASQHDMAQAYRVMLPREPSGDYWIISLAYFRDYNSTGIHGSRLPETIHRRIHEEYEAGFRALSVETDFNFGKMGLEYYLYSKMLWNPKLTLAELQAIRDRWLQRSFGSGWQEMKEYYEFMAPENYAINAPNNWAKAIRFIEAADQKIDPNREPDAQKRLDDLKQFWYFYYLLESEQAEPPSPALKEFLWKGQMSYMNAMHMVARRFFNTNNVREATGTELNSGPAHYTHEETQTWWTKVLDTWKVTPVTDFSTVTLANGKKGSEVDTNDVATFAEFESKQADVPFVYNSGYQKEASFLTVVSETGEEIGFKLFWPWKADDNYYRARDVFYGISRWNSQQKEWEELVDKTMTSVPSQLATEKSGKEHQLAEVRYKVPRPGTYRVEVGKGGNLARLTTLNYNLLTGEYSGTRGHTYFDNLVGLTQSPTYMYIPKGTKSIDLEIWDTNGGKKLHLHTGLPATGMKRTRIVDISARGTHTVKLEPGEDGSIAMLQANGFAFPHLYSVPMLYAKSPAALLVPRVIAQADGLTAKR